MSNDKIEIMKEILANKDAAQANFKALNDEIGKLEKQKMAISEEYGYPIYDDRDSIYFPKKFFEVRRTAKDYYGDLISDEDKVEDPDLIIIDEFLTEFEDFMCQCDDYGNEETIYGAGWWSPSRC